MSERDRPMLIRDWPRFAADIQADVRRERRVRLLEGLALGLAAGLLAGILIGRTALAAPRPALGNETSPVSGSEFRALPEASRDDGASVPSLLPVAPSVGPTATVAAFPGSSPAPARTTTPGRPSLRLSATYYCRAGVSRCTRGYPDRRGVADLFAAISPDLRYLRGRQVSVCRPGGSCVSVRIIDCNCAATRAIDLYADAFARLAPLSLGRISVVVTWW